MKLNLLLPLQGGSNVGVIKFGLGEWFYSEVGWGCPVRRWAACLERIAAVARTGDGHASRRRDLAITSQLDCCSLLSMGRPAFEDHPEVAPCTKCCLYSPCPCRYARISAWASYFEGIMLASRSFCARFKVLILSDMTP